jgi:hypothetical protein
MEDNTLALPGNIQNGCTAVRITWEHQLRTRSLALRLGVPLRENSLPRDRFQRYVLGALRTIRVLRPCHAEVVIAQNPSIFLCWLLLTVRRLFRDRLVIGAHYGGVVAYNGNRLFQWAIDYCNRKADLVIVTNAGHAQQVHRLGGKAYVCEDPLPDLHQYGVWQESESGKCVFFICSFDVDEPRQAMLEAAQRLSDDGFHVYISGDYPSSC